MKASDQAGGDAGGLNGWATALARHPGRLAAALGVLVLATFWPATGFDFLNFDDPDYVTKNPQVQAGLTAEGIHWAFTRGHSGNWHPLTWISHMLDRELFGPGPAGPHFVNIALHGFNAALVFLALRRLTGATWRCFLVAALFAVHPLRVESVAWIAERKDVLSACFGLGAIWAYAGVARQAERGLRRLWLALLLFALSLMSKPMLVTLPFLLLLLDYWPLRRLSQPLARGPVQTLMWEKWPFFVLSATSSVVTFLVQDRSGAVQSLSHMPLSARLENAVVSYARYLGKLFWPANLATPYPHPGDWPWPMVLGAVVLLGVVTLLVLKFGGRHPHLPVGWFWYLGLLVPVIGLVQVGAQSMADRYTYLPGIGILLMLAWWLFPGVAREAGSTRLWLVTGAVVLVLVLAGTTRAQLAHWRNSEMLFTHALRVTEGNWLAHYNLAWHLESAGRQDEALRHYEAAVKIKPNCAEAWNNLGYILAARREYDPAVQAFEMALRARPGLADARNNLGKAFEETRGLDAAIEQYRLALQAQPEHTGVLNNLGLALARKGDWAEALRFFQASLRVDNRQPTAHYHAGTAFARMRQPAPAIGHYRAALSLNPDYAQAHNDLALALAAHGQPGEAIQHLRQAVKLRPDDVSSLLNLGKLLATSGQSAEAVALFQRATQLAPGNADARNALGSGLVNAGDLNGAVEQFRESLKLRPGYALTHLNLGRALAGLGMTNEAASHLREAVSLRPELEPSLGELRSLLAQ